MSERPKSILCFDNYTEAKMALGKVEYPIVIKPYECEDESMFYQAENYGKATQLLYDAFEHTRNGWIAIESYSEE